MFAISQIGGYKMVYHYITNVVLHNKGSRPVLYFISKDGYKYRDINKYIVTLMNLYA